MKHNLWLWCLISLSVFASQWALAQQPPRILMVVSSYGEDQGKTRPGFDFDEFSRAYLIFTRHGLAVNVASPKGDNVVANQYDPSKAYNTAVLSDQQAMHALANSIPSKALDPKHYAAVFVVGGKGAMFDLPNNTALSQMIAAIYEQQGVVAAVCHGPAALVNVELADGTLLVKGKRVNGFTNQEEKLFGKKWSKKFDFLLEDKLKQQGGVFQSSPIMLNHVSVDERLITAQNPFSTTAAAEKLVGLLGIEVSPAEPDIEELTIAFIARVLKGDKQAIKEVQVSDNSYLTPLIGMYGYYYLQLADTPLEIRAAIQLMKMAAPKMKNETIDLALASAYEQLGEHSEARQVLRKVLENNPEAANAKLLLAKLEGK